MPRYRIEQGPLQHDDKRFDAGDLVDMSADAAAPLLAANVLTSARGERAPAPTPAPASAHA